MKQGSCAGSWGGVGPSLPPGSPLQLGSGDILLDNLQGFGSESQSRLGQCPSSGWSDPSCGHHENAGVVCSATWLSLPGAGFLIFQQLRDGRRCVQSRAGDLAEGVPSARLTENAKEQILLGAHPQGPHNCQGVFSAAPSRVWSCLPNMPFLACVTGNLPAWDLTENHHLS